MGRHDSSSSTSTTFTSSPTITSPAASVSATSKSTCNGHDWGTVEPIVGSMTYHTLITIIAGICTILTIVICGLLAASHLFRFRRPDEQKQTVRIIWAPAIIAVCSIFGVWFYDVAGYLKPIGEYYECFALVAIFYLFINHATPADYDRMHPFNKLENIAATYQNTSLPKLYNIWISVVQIVVVRLVTLIVTLAIWGSECDIVSKRSHAETAINAIQTGSTVFCFLALLKMHRILKPSLVSYRAMLKLLALKLIVGLDVLQALVFSILSNEGDINPTKYATVPDLMIGSQDFMLCSECFLISIVFVFAYSARDYSTKTGAGNTVEGGQQIVFKKTNFCVAMFDALDISDILMGVVYCFKAWSGRSGNSPTGYSRQQMYASNGYSNSPGHHETQQIQAPDGYDGYRREMRK